MVNALLDTIYQTGQVEQPDGESRSCFPVSVPRDSATALYEVVKQQELDRTLEVGLAYGLSALSICQAHEDKGRGQHIAIDPKQSDKWQAIGVENVRRAGLDHRFEFLEDTSDRALPRLAAEGRRIDFAFIDGLHLFDYALVDFFYVDKMLEVGGFLAMDDLWMPAMRKVVSYILTNRSYERVRPLAGRPPLGLAIGRVGRRFLRDPLGGNLNLKLIPSNLIFLRKADNDSRYWTFHRGF